MKSSLQLVNELVSELETATMSSNNVTPYTVVPSSSGSVPKSTKFDNIIKDSETKQAKPAKPAKQPRAKAVPAVPDEINANSIEFRVGKIVSVYKHESADKLYCEMIDIGEAEPRAIASGLVMHYSLEEMKDRRLIVVANLKPRNLCGFKSNGMVLCAASKDPVTGVEKVEFVDPPADAAIGELVIGEGLTNKPLAPNQIDKKKVFEAVGADLKVNEDGVAMWKHLKLVTANSALTCSTPTIRNAELR